MYLVCYKLLFGLHFSSESKKAQFVSGYKIMGVLHRRKKTTILQKNTNKNSEAFFQTKLYAFSG
jgi:hypothetical protein